MKSLVSSWNCIRSVVSDCCLQPPRYSDQGFVRSPPTQTRSIAVLAVCPKKFLLAKTVGGLISVLVKSRSTATVAFFRAAMVVCIIAAGSVAPKSRAQQVAPPPHTIPIEHYYRHYLVHQNLLDQLAAARDAKGQDGTWMRNHLQLKLGFSDADYAFVRSSSQSLAGKIKSLDAQALAIKSAGLTSTSQSQLQALAAQREMAVNAEVSSLRAKLPPAKISALEVFMVQFFSQGSSIPKPSLSIGSTPAAVQQ
jgi:hypothetical protein